jgi:hypothetical protein
VSPELDKQLCEKYPKIFRDRHAPMTQTCMCWGLEVGDGWFNIMNRACSLVQSYIDQKRAQRLSAIKFNRALKQALEKNNKLPLIKHYTIGGNVEWAERQVERDLSRPLYRPVPETVNQVVATQVKEKFGTLRFYYNGGDDYCDGVIHMAESMTGCTCEECGKPGRSNTSGWIKVRCLECFKDETFGSDVL